MRRRLPAATYRLQLRNGVDFEAAAGLAGYLRELGASSLYASPTFRAREGSPHGYDVVDPTVLDPALGTREAFEALVAALAREGLGLVLDIVPNHMAVSPENPWWMDVLENGADSPRASWFDIFWREGRTQIELPVLGEPFEQALVEGKLVPLLASRGFQVRYGSLAFPLGPAASARILAHDLDALERALGPDDHAARRLRRIIEELTERGAGGSDDDEAEREAPLSPGRALKARLWRLYRLDADVRAHVERSLARLRGLPGDRESFRPLEELLAGEAWRLGFWRTAVSRLTYRRFFDISDLISVRVEDAAVLESTHALVFDLVADGLVHGLRVDHVDGLYDPQGYLQALLEEIGAGGPRTWLVVEKILARDERLSADWPVHGTTGYEFARVAGNLFVDERGLERLGQIYREHTGAPPFAEVVYDCKRGVIRELFAAQLRRLHARFALIVHELPADVPRPPSEALVDALIQVSACLPVYRTYVRGAPVASEDRAWIDRAVAEARRQSDAALHPAIDLLRRVLLLDAPAGADAAVWLRFVMRWQQLTGPAMAKGYEDTALYRWYRLISLNEVGGDPAGPADPVAELHAHNRLAREHWPHGMLATSTHDTKRSEDVRARIHVLSELPEVWAEALTRWRSANARFTTALAGGAAPDADDEIMIYQTLLGAWPLDPGERADFPERLRGWLVKSAREAKRRTSWIEPDADYEAALEQFLDALLGEPGRSFRDDLRALGDRVAWHGALNALGQVLVKIASPGVPDVYQGQELWDFSLVDPDNRRPVDFARRARSLDELGRRAAGDLAVLARELIERWPDGRIKLWVTWRALGFRRERPELFTEGTYHPLALDGPRARHAFAFARSHGRDWAVAVVPRLTTALAEPGLAPLGTAAWADTALALPPNAPRTWSDVLSGATVAGGERLALARVLGDLPLALLRGTAS